MTVGLLVLGAGSAEAGDELARANEAFGKQAWQRAAKLYERALADASSEVASEERGNAWFQYGYAHYRLGNDRQALDAYAEAERLGVATPRLLGTAAVAAHRSGDKKLSWSYLDRAVDAGMPPAVLLSNPEFAPFRDSPRFAEKIEAARQRAFPCLGHDPSHSFDFWLGTWNVLAGGQQVGVNRITSHHEGCLILEDYTTRPGGFSGMSFNFYDPAIDAWRQIWVDTGGQVTHYQGRFENGAMRFEGQTADRSGNRANMRLTFTPNKDGSVRQLFERQAEDGTWTAGFDGRYERQKGN